MRLCTYVVDSAPEDLVADAPVAGDVPAARVHDGSGPVGRRPDVRAHVIYDDLRVVDLHDRDRGRVLRQAARPISAPTSCSRTPVGGDPLFTYLRTSQRDAERSRPVARGGRHRHRGRARVDAPAVRRRSSRSRSPRSATVAPTTASNFPEEVLQARSGSLSAHGHMHLPPLDGRRPARRVHRRRVRGAGRADGMVACVAHGNCGIGRRVDARGDPADLRHDADAHGAFPRRAPSSRCGG